MNWLESQIEIRSRLDNEMAERAYAELASSVGGDPVAVGLDATQRVDAAARACLVHMGVEPGVVPDELADADERIEWLCRPSATMRRVVRLDADWQYHAAGAMLGHLDTGEAVALIPRPLRGYTLFDPDSGGRVKVTRKVAERLSDEAILFYKPLPSKPLKMRDLLTFIIASIDRGDVMMAALAALVATLIGLGPAWANKVAYGTVVPSGQASLVAPVAALLLGLTISTALIGICRTLILGRIVSKLSLTCEAATFARTLALPTSFFKKYSSGDLASRLQTVTQLAQMLASVLLDSTLMAILSLSYVVQIGAYAPALALPALAVVLLQSAFTLVVTRLTNRYERESMDANAKLSGTVTALLNGIQKIKLAGAEDRAFAKWAHGYAAYARPTYNRPALTRALPAFVALIALLGNIVIYYLAGSSHVSMSDFMAFSVAYGQVSAAVMALATVADQAVRIRPMFEMVAPILEATPEVAKERPSVDNLTGGIEISNVSFRYDENNPYVLNNISFRVRAGEYVALVGRSGCGKSTILRLMLGFETPERGTIFYGSHDISKIDLRSLRRQIGVVMQDGQLFMGDLASNITIASPAATLDDAWEAAEIAGIADDIRKMPMGMQTIVTEGGGGISGGQRQRIMIARAVCGKRRILMLDEATSALDNVTQKHVSDSLEKLKCTRIVVAHRLSTVRHCDRILVVDGGRIVEEGNYEELLKRGGFFADLVERQRLYDEV